MMYTQLQNSCTRLLVQDHFGNGVPAYNIDRLLWASTCSSRFASLCSVCNLEFRVTNNVTAASVTHTPYKEVAQDLNVYHVTHTHEFKTHIEIEYCSRILKSSTQHNKMYEFSSLTYTSGFATTKW